MMAIKVADRLFQYLEPVLIMVLSGFCELPALSNDNSALSCR
jgi:hypothetical protein